MRPRAIKTDIAGIEVVDGYKLVTSYSQIDKYLSCPYSWHLRYVVGIKANIKAKALEYGLTVHDTMEYFFSMLMLGIMLDIVDVKGFYLKTFDDREIPFDSEEESQEYFKEGLNAIEYLYAPLNEAHRIMVDPDNEILGVEENFEVLVKLPKEIEVAYKDEDGIDRILVSDEVWVMGFIDLVIRTKQGIVVIDHKSGKTKFDKEKLATNLQFPIYAMAVLEKYGELPVKSLYNFTKLHKCQEVVVDEERIELSKVEMVGIFKKMNRDKHTAKPTFFCYWCDFSKHKLNVCHRSTDFKPKNAK